MTAGTFDEVSESEECAGLAPHYDVPRGVAGGPDTGEMIKCPLKPLSRAGYDVTFSDAEWAQLQAAFPTGVCNFRKPAVGLVAGKAWQTFEDGPAGRVLPAAPQSVALPAAAIRPGANDIPAGSGKNLAATGVSALPAAFAVCLLAIASALRRRMRASR